MLANPPDRMRVTVAPQSAPRRSGEKPLSYLDFA